MTAFLLGCGYVLKVKREIYDFIDLVQWSSQILTK